MRTPLRSLRAKRRQRELRTRTCATACVRAGVWQVYSEDQQRWIHCDPCENAWDSPLLYSEAPQHHHVSHPHPSHLLRYRCRATSIHLLLHPIRRHAWWRGRPILPPALLLLLRRRLRRLLGLVFSNACKCGQCGDGVGWYEEGESTENSE